MAEGDEKALAKRGPVELSFDQAERVLHRALELQQRERGTQSVTLEEVERMAEELGVPAERVRDAYRDVRTRALVPVARPGALDRVFGPARVVVTRSVPGEVEAVRARVHGYLEDQMFKIKRNLGDRTIWEPAEGLMHSIKRAVDFSDRYDLPTTMDVEVAVAAAPNGETDVAIALDLSRSRGQALTIGGVGAVVLAGVGVGLGIALTPWAFPAGAALGAGSLALGRRAFRSDATAARDAVERLLDGIEHG